MYSFYYDVLKAKYKEDVRLIYTDTDSYGTQTFTEDIYEDWKGIKEYMGLSENSVPLNPMVLLIIIPIKWLFHWEYTLFSDKPIWTSVDMIGSIPTVTPPIKKSLASSRTRWMEKSYQIS